MTKYRIPSDYENQTPRATHNRQASAYGTIHPGLAIPVHHRHLNVGDRIRGRIDQLLQSQPMLGPLMNGFKQITIATFLPDSAIYGWLRNGKRYTPEQYMKFGKLYFNLASKSITSHTDPVFKTNSYRFRYSCSEQYCYWCSYAYWPRWSLGLARYCPWCGLSEYRYYAGCSLPFFF